MPTNKVSPVIIGTGQLSPIKTRENDVDPNILDVGKEKTPKNLKTSKLPPIVKAGTQEVVDIIDFIISYISQENIKNNSDEILKHLEKISKEYKPEQNAVNDLKESNVVDVDKSSKYTIIHWEFNYLKNTLTGHNMSQKIMEENLKNDVVLFLQNFKICLSKNKPLNEKFLDDVKKTVTKNKVERKKALIGDVIGLIQNPKINFDAVKFLSALQTNELRLNTQLLEDLKRTCFGEGVEGENIIQGTNVEGENLINAQTRKDIAGLLKPDINDKTLTNRLEGLLLEVKGAIFENELELQGIVKKIKNFDTQFNVPVFLEILSNFIGGENVNVRLRNKEHKPKTLKDLADCFGGDDNGNKLTDEARRKIIDLFKSPKNYIVSQELRTTLQNVWTKDLSTKVKVNMNASSTSLSSTSSSSTTSVRSSLNSTSLSLIPSSASGDRVEFDGGHSQTKNSTITNVTPNQATVELFQVKNQGGDVPRMSFNQSTEQTNNQATEQTNNQAKMSFLSKLKKALCCGGGDNEVVPFIDK